ncbi:hypothetical protein HNR05_000190 [Leifsonia psychrotolerans]|uniref:DarT domain-containing protein n=1 Tax=Glaciibacter psychrotolerans TaxID=670054 RepID=A0A7Z0EB84_9MICO|nr:hypothetical protein [Leifsonia psychrotolerans]
MVSNPSQRASKARERVAPTTLRTAPVAPKTSAGAKAAAPVRSAAVKVGDQRIYHVTHIKNLADILVSGAVNAMQGATATTPVVDISSEGNRAWRASTHIAGDDSASVADYVPFFLSPDASVWESIRSGAIDPRLTTTATDAAAADFVILVSAVKNATALHPGDVPEDDTAIVVTDADAALERTRFGATRDGAERLLHTVRSNPASGAILEAEFLVHGTFPFDQIMLIGVANDRVRDTVKGILKPSGFRTKVAVYPPWFLPSDDDSLDG